MTPRVCGHMQACVAGVEGVGRGEGEKWGGNLPLLLLYFARTPHAINLLKT